MKEKTLDSRFFQEQGKSLNKEVLVRFEKDTEKKEYLGRIIREDTTQPGIILIQLNNGKYVISPFDNIEYRFYKNP